MRRLMSLLPAFWLLIAFFSCGQEKASRTTKDPTSALVPNSYEESDTPSFQALPSALKAWFDYCRKMDPGFQLGAFKASGVTLHFDNQLHLPYVQTDRYGHGVSRVYTSDQTKALDFVHTPAPAASGIGSTMSAKRSYEQELWLIDLKRNTKVRLMQTDTLSHIETVDWLNPHSFVAGVMRSAGPGDSLIAEMVLFHIPDSTFTNFRKESGFWKGGLNGQGSGFWQETTKTLH